MPAAKIPGDANRSHLPTYRSWMAMRTRCQCETYPKWDGHGGRGIQVCQRWNDFRAFLEDMGERPQGTTLDRINNNGNYEPGNCRWATPIEQAQNRRIPAAKSMGSGPVFHIRMQLGIKQADLGEKIGATEKMVCHAEKKGSWPFKACQKARLQDLARAEGININEFLNYSASDGKEAE